MLKLRLSRLWLRQALKLVGGIFILSVTLFLVDFYYNFLPPSIQSRFSLHQPGHVVVDIKVETCLLNSRCPITNDEWFQIPKDLYLDSVWGKHAYVYVKRANEKDLASTASVVLDAAVAETKSNKPPAYVIDDVSASQKTGSTADSLLDQAKGLGWDHVGHGIWLKRGKYLRYKSVTSVDVLFGPDASDPRENWHLKPNYIAQIKTPGPRLTIRVGPKAEKVIPELRVGKDGKFKIIQLADLHFSTGVGKCRDLFPKDAVKSSENGCEADPRTLEFINKVLDAEKPDYVVLTGDQIFGETSPDSETAMLKVVSPLIARKIPYSMVMGNHDDEGGSLSRHDLMAMVSELPYSLTQLGPPEISGYGNYVQQVLGPKSDNPALTFYFLDSHSQSPNPKVNPGYAWIEPDQLDWVQKEYQQLKPGQDSYSHIHMSMAFFHIPIPEYVSKKPFIGNAREPVTASRYNTGARDVLAKIGVSVVSVGHDHVNDYCMFHDKTEEATGKESSVWLCFGGATGEGGYGGYGGYERRIRVFELDTQAASIKSYKLLHDNPETKIDNQILVKDGKAWMAS